MIRGSDLCSRLRWPMIRFSRKIYFASLACLVSVWVATLPTALAESGNFSMSYSGRLTQADGAPVSGPVDVSVKFWSAAEVGNTLGAPIELTNIPLNQGVFTIQLDLIPPQITAVFGQGADPVFIEITAAGKTYPRQQYSYVPFALRLPVDAKTLAFDADGKLGLSLTSQPSANQFLTKDSNGRLAWGSPSVTTLQGQSIASTAPTSGQILTYSGGQWVPQTLAVAGAAGGTVTNVTGTAPLTVTSGTTTPMISMAQASGSANGYLSSADWTAFNAKPGTAVTSVATGTGLTGGPITSSGTISLSNTSVTPGSYTRANIAVDAQGRLTSAANGASVNLASEVSGTLPVGNGGTGAVSFTNNGILVGSGSLPVSTVTGVQYQVLTAVAGGTPSFGSLNLDQSAAVTGILPRANGGTGVNSTATFPSSGVIVTEGATETLSNKTLSGALISASTVNGASLIGGSTTIDTAGTLKSGAAMVAGNVSILGNSTTANRLVLNDKGSTNSVALKAPDTLTSSLTLELPSSNGSAGQVLATNGSGILSWVSAATGSVTNVTGTAPISVATGTSTPVISMSQANGSTNGYLNSADWTTFNSKQPAGNYLTSLTGDVSASGAGSAAATLAAVAIAGTSTKVTYDVKGRVTSGTSLEAADLPSHSAALITSGTLAVANGGTGANLDTTGGAGQYLKQTTSGGSVTVGTIAASDITSSLGYTPLNKAGDTITGAVNFGSNDLSNAGNIQMAASKTLALSTNSSDPSGLAAGDVGKTWFNSSTNQIKYWNGSAAVALGAAGSGLSNLNGQTGNTQTFATPGTSGTAPTWSSVSNAHTLNIPMASAASVTAGLLSNADYAAFNSKQPAGNYVTTLTGDVTTSGFSAGSATATLASVSSGGTSTKVTFDTKGRVTSGATLSASDIPPLSAAIITSGTLANANGGTGVNSTATFPTTGVVVTEAATETLTNKTLTAATINGASSIGGATTINTTGTLSSGAQNVAGNITILGNSTTANKLVLNDKGSTNSVALRAPDTLASSLTWELPSTNGSSGQVLSTNGSGTLSWVSAAVGSVTNVTGTAPISVATGTSTPVISMAQANGSTNGYLSSADWTTFNGKQAYGSYISALSGDVTATGPGSAAATLAAVAIAGTSTKVTYDVKGRVTSGTSLTAADIPPLGAGIITSGTLAIANGGTGLSSTPANGQIPIGNGTNYNLATLTAGTGININNASGAVTVSATADASTKVSKTGDTMTGSLTLPSTGLIAGANQLVLANGNVGIGTTSPSAALEVSGQVKITGGNPAAGKVLTSDANGLASWSFVAFMPAGVILPFAGATAPSGYLLCDGSSLLRADYSGLFAVIGTAYGAVDGTHFNLPDMRGKFMRGTDNMGTAAGAAGQDPNATARASCTTGGNSGNSVGSCQGAATAVSGLSNASSSINGTAAAQSWSQIGSGTAAAQSWTYNANSGTAAAQSWTQSYGYTGTLPPAPAQDIGGYYNVYNSVGGGWHAFTWNGSPGASPAYVGGSNSASSVSGVTGYNAASAVTGVNGANTSSSVSGTAAAQVLSSTDLETRPKNVNVNYIIKY